MRTVLVIVIEDGGPPLQLTTRRVSWFENLGSNAGQWKRKEIGKFPGARILKGMQIVHRFFYFLLLFVQRLIADLCPVGHFTNNFGVQIVIIPEDINSAVPKPSSIVVYTQPLNVTSAPQWLSNVSTLSNVYAISDVIVLPSMYLLMSLFSWHLSCTNFLDQAHKVV
jgi:hypothetical protein